MTDVDAPRGSLPRRPPSPIRRPRAAVVGIAIPLALYAIVIVLSGASPLLHRWRRPPRGPQPTRSGAQWGQPRDIRSDEYLTQSSQELAVLATGHSTHSAARRASRDVTFQISSGQLAESVLFFESTTCCVWARCCQTRSSSRPCRGFYDLLLLALTLPPLLRRFGATTPTALAGVRASRSSPPSTLWWLIHARSDCSSHASAGCLFLLLAHEQWVSARRSRPSRRCVGRSP